MKYNKKASVLVSILVSIAILIIFYIVITILSFISPSFAQLTASINYFILIALFVIVQAVFLYGYYLLGKYVVSGFFKFKDKVMKVSLNFEKYLIKKKIGYG